MHSSNISLTLSIISSKSWKYCFWSAKESPTLEKSSTIWEESFQKTLNLQSWEKLEKIRKKLPKCRKKLFLAFWKVLNPRRTPLFSPPPPASADTLLLYSKQTEQNSGSVLTIGRSSTYGWITEFRHICCVRFFFASITVICNKRAWRKYLVLE